MDALAKYLVEIYYPKGKKIEFEKSSPRDLGFPE